MAWDLAFLKTSTFRPGTRWASKMPAAALLVLGAQANVLLNTRQLSRPLMPPTGMVTLNAAARLAAAEA